uniref:Candidate secreted effector n=1 Tax=Meloidogyne incognita TaxID=6306 RepID=A0A914MKE1_MELIC
MNSLNGKFILCFLLLLSFCTNQIETQCAKTGCPCNLFYQCPTTGKPFNCSPFGGCICANVPGDAISCGFAGIFFGCCLF